MTSTLDERVDAAESEGTHKNFINEELKELPNYGKMCDCAFPQKYCQWIEDGYVSHRLMCLNCGGMMFE